jgi:uncharacterized protein YbjT (DUF2867 family)
MRTIASARRRLLDQLAAATPAQFADIMTLLRQGAGLLPLPEGTTLSEPKALPPDRREAAISLYEALVATPRGDWQPVYVGDWESVLASLVVDGEWRKIAEAARELEAQV